MSKYFDKDFFKFFLGFAAIISTSIIIILAARVYEQGGVSSDSSASVIKSVTK